LDWYMAVMRKYADFNGRARRQEYWMFQLINMLIGFAFAIVIIAAAVLFQHSQSQGFVVLFMIPLWLYCLAIFIPSLAVTVRRLHDIGKSGWWYFIAFVPFVGGIVLLVFTCMDSEPGPNLYGPSPKYAGSYGYAQPLPPAY